MAKLIIPSSRPCPNCKGMMHYKKSLSTFLTGKYRRVCRACGYKDPNRVRLYPINPYN